MVTATRSVGSKPEANCTIGFWMSTLSTVSVFGFPFLQLEPVRTVPPTFSSTPHILEGETKEVGKDKSVSARYWQPERMVHALNRMLPPDVRVTRATDTAAQNFSPTHDALGKEYRYMVDTSSFNRCDPNRRFFRWHLRSIAAADYNSNDQGCFRAATDTKICSSKSKLDGSLQAWLGPEVRRAADFLQGTHDFTAFRLTAY